MLADVTGRPVVLSPGALPAAGACLQAAAVLHGEPPSEVAARWALGAGAWLEPRPDPAVDDRRAAYTEARARYERAGLTR